jgi:hypothetical protein
MNSVITVTKHSILETVLRVNEIGLEGYEKPNKAQTEKTRNIEARAKNVRLEKHVMMFISGTLNKSIPVHHLSYY